MSLPKADRGMVVRTYRETDEEAVIALWHRCQLVVPWNDPHEDIAAKMAFQPELFIVGEIDGRVVATAMAGYEGHRGWINYLAVDPNLRRQGIGSAIMRRAERALCALGCPKINLQVRESNEAVIAFYEQLGFSQEQRISMGKRLKPQGGR
jgi:ribosomal protein S18 acetylase RimI-like enzyme